METTTVPAQAAPRGTGGIRFYDAITSRSLASTSIPGDHVTQERWATCALTSVCHLMFACFLMLGSTAANGGTFLDDLLLKDVGDGRRFALLSQFRYLDSDGITWVVPPGEVVDGASIPPALWSITGGPWSGKYRRASVIHDYFFRTKKYDSDAVHRVFYDAMIADDVPILKAKAMYYAVLRFNARWLQVSHPPECGGLKYHCKPEYPGDWPTYWDQIPTQFDSDDLESATKLIDAENLNLTQIKDLADRRRVQSAN